METQIPDDAIRSNTRSPGVISDDTSDGDIHMPSTPPTDRIMTRAEKRRLETEWNDTEPTRRGSREGSGDEARRRPSVDTNGTPFGNAEYTDPPVIPRRRTRRNAGTGDFFC